jgi:hypothetical protein
MCVFLKQPTFVHERSFKIKNFFRSIKRQEIEAEGLAAQQSLAVVEWYELGIPNGFVELVLLVPGIWIGGN